MKISSYRTNAVCPRCRNQLYTQDYVGQYPLTCRTCDEDFYFIENASYTDSKANPVFEVYIPMKYESLVKNHVAARHILPTARFSYDHLHNEAILIFEDYEYLLNRSERIMPKIRNVGRLK